MSKYTDWKAQVIGRGIDVDKAYGNQCVDVSNHYAMYLFPGYSWATLMGAPMSAKDLFDTANPNFFDKVRNNPADVNQLPPQGAIAVFAAAPEAGYTSTYPNPDGHVGIVDSADSRYLYLVQQDGSTGQGVTYLKQRPWRYTRCIGWLIPKAQEAPAPAPKPQYVTLPAHVQKWAAYVENGVYNRANGTFVELAPAKFGGLTYVVQRWVANGAAAVIKTEMFGERVIWVKDTDAVIH